MLDAQPLKKSRLVVQTSLDALKEVWFWFEQFNLPPVPNEVWVQCQLALTEGFTNVVRYSHQHLPQTTLIDIEVRLFPNLLEMRIWDCGQPLNVPTKPQLHLQKQLPVSGEERLAFLSRLIDELSYIRQPDRRNCLLMRKRIN